MTEAKRAPIQQENWMTELAAIHDPEDRYSAAEEIRGDLVEMQAVGDKVIAPCKECDGLGCSECEYSGGIVGEIVPCKPCEGDGQLGVVIGDQFMHMTECLRCHGEGRVLETTA